MRDDDPREESMNKHTKRRKRRRANAKLRNGAKAVRAHRKIGGRTGQVQAKRVPSNKRMVYRVARPNPPGPIGLGLGRAKPHI